MFYIFVVLGLPINTTPVKEHRKEVEDVTHKIDEDKKIDTLNGRVLHNDEAFFKHMMSKKENQKYLFMIPLQKTIFKI